MAFDRGVSERRRRHRETVKRESDIARLVEEVTQESATPRKSLLRRNATTNTPKDTKKAIGVRRIQIQDASIATVTKTCVTKSDFHANLFAYREPRARTTSRQSPCLP
jgi:hypothetical protein